MPSFHEVQFPPRIGYGAKGGPGFSTNIISMANGAEQRNINWSKSRGAWNVGTGIQNLTQFATVLNFFYARWGKAYGFRFKDWFDFQVTGSLFGTGDGTTNVFQLSKVYSDGTYSYTRQIRKPVNSSALKIYDNAVLLTTGYSVDYTTGLVTFTAAPTTGHLLTWDGEFDVPCRFDIDNLQAQYDAYNSTQIADIPIVELKY